MSFRGSRMGQGRAGMGTCIIAPSVGVIAGERLFGAAQPAPPIVYVPYTWNVWPNIFVAVRSSMPTATLAPLLKAAVFSVEPAVPVAGTSPWTTFRPLGFYIDGLLQARRVNPRAVSGVSIGPPLPAASLQAAQKVCFGRPGLRKHLSCLLRERQRFAKTAMLLAITHQFGILGGICQMGLQRVDHRSGSRQLRLATQIAMKSAAENAGQTRVGCGVQGPRRRL